jgi:hypothetical protein
MVHLPPPQPLRRCRPGQLPQALRQQQQQATDSRRPLVLLHLHSLLWYSIILPCLAAC